MDPSGQEHPRPQDPARAWLEHYAAVSRDRLRRARPRRRRLLILGHKVEVRTLLAGAAVAVIAAAALLAAVLAAS